jgi:hypothetical protein
MDDWCAFPALHEAYVHREAGKALVNSIWEWSIKWQLLLGGKKTLNKDLRQTLELEVIKLAVRSPIRSCKMSDRTLLRSQTLHPTPQMKDYQELTCQWSRSTSHFRQFYSHKLEAEALGPAQHWGAIRKGNHRHHRHVSSEKSKWQYACMLLGMSSLKEGAILHHSWKLEYQTQKSRPLLGIGRYTRFHGKPKHAAKSIIPGPSLGNSPFNKSLNNIGILEATFPVWSVLKGYITTTPAESTASQEW